MIRLQAMGMSLTRDLPSTSGDLQSDDQPEVLRANLPPHRVWFRLMSTGRGVTLPRNPFIRGTERTIIFDWCRENDIKVLLMSSAAYFDNETDAALCKLFFS